MFAYGSLLIQSQFIWTKFWVLEIRACSDHNLIIIVWIMREPLASVTSYRHVPCDIESSFQCYPSHSLANLPASQTHGGRRTSMAPMWSCCPRRVMATGRQTWLKSGANSFLFIMSSRLQHVNQFLSLHVSLPPAMDLIHSYTTSYDTSLCFS